MIKKNIYKCILHYESDKDWNSDTVDSLRMISESVSMETPTQFSWFSMDVSSSSVWWTIEGGSDVLSRWLPSMETIMVCVPQSSLLTMTASDSMSCVSVPSSMDGLWLDEEGMGLIHRESEVSSFRGKSSVFGSSKDCWDSSKFWDWNKQTMSNAQFISLLSLYSKTWLIWHVLVEEFCVWMDRISDYIVEKTMGMKINIG